MSRKARIAAKAQGADPDPRAAAAGPQPPAIGVDWTSQLAELLLQDLASDAARPGLRALWSSHATGDAAVDGNRLALLGLLGRHLGQAWQPPRLDRPSPLPPWPDSEHSDLPQLHPTGAWGVSLVTLCRGQDEAEVAALLAGLPGWLAAGLDEVVVVELSDTPCLAQRLLQLWPQPDARLHLAEVSGPDVTEPQAWNAALRLARHQDILCLAPGMALPGRLSDRALAGPGRFGLDNRQADGRRFLLALDRADLARVGGFNETLPSMAFAAEELSARLLALGLALRPPETAPPADRPPQPALAADGSLRQALEGHPALAALVNRHIAALMPDWRADSLCRAFAFAGPGRLGPRLVAIGPSALPVPAPLRDTAEARALSDLVAAHLGLPVLIGQRRLDMVLQRPARDVCALDVAVAASHAPDAVRSRRAWLVIDIAPEAFPSPGSPALAAFLWLLDRAATLGSSPVLRLGDPPPQPLDDPLAHLPQIAADPALTQGFWPATLGDLVPDRRLDLPSAPGPLPHAMLHFNLGFLDDHARFTKRGPAIFLRRPKLFIDAQHGLGNRLRAMASAAAIAEATGRELIVVWQPDAHCDCTFDSLFIPDGAVLDQCFAAEAPGMGLDLFNYMQVESGAAKDQPIRLNATRDAYIRSAYPLVHPASTWHSENRALRRFRPGEVVQDRVASLGPARPDLAVHIRMEGGRAAEHLAYEAPTNWTAEAHRTIDHWRRRSHYSYFLPRIDQLVAEGLAKTIFLATDTPEVYDILARRYGHRLGRLARPATDRSAIALVHALADALLLSRASRLLGSTWSSFTELASRLADHPIEVELSGRDF